MAAARLIPNVVLLRVAEGTELRSAAARAVACCDDAVIAPASRALLRASAETGAFGALELAALSAYLHASGDAVGVRALVAQATRSAAAAASEPHEAAARDAWRAGARARAAHREYGALLAAGGGPSGDVGSERTGGTVRSFGAQAMLGGGLLLALASGTLLGVFVGRRLYGDGSQGMWVTAVASAIATLALEATLLVLRLSRVDALAHQRALKQPPRDVATPRVEWRLGAELGAEPGALEPGGLLGDGEGRQRAARTEAPAAAGGGAHERAAASGSSDVAGGTSAADSGDDAALAGAEDDAAPASSTAWWRSRCPYDRGDHRRVRRSMRRQRVVYRLFHVFAAACIAVWHPRRVLGG